MSDCDKRPCIVEMQRPKNKGWSRIAIGDADVPTVFKCTCQAKMAISIAWAQILSAILQGGLSIEDAPINARIVYVDKEPALLDAEVSDTAQANDIINKIMGK